MSREITIAYVDLDELAAARDPRNAKRHALGAIDRSLERFGDVAPVILNDGDASLLAGHGRVQQLLARRQRGAPAPDGIRVEGERWLVPTVRGFNFDSTEAEAYRLADNRVGELGGWDDRRLAAVLQDLAALGTGLDGTGFGTADLDALLADLSLPAPETVDPDDVPALPASSDLRVALGDVWRLGPHLVVCGDATNADDVRRLISSAHVAMAFTDPPYNVDLGNHSGATRGRRRTITNDHMAPGDWARFVAAISAALMEHVHGAIYVCMSSKEWPTVAQALADAGGHWSDTIIWAKGGFTLGRSDHQRAYEPIWYGWPEGQHHYWSGARDQSDVWEFPKPQRSELHPTMKPVALVERALRNSSQSGDAVLDLFLGSGTTLVAAERTGRVCLGMEVDPRYVQVVIERWERLTGRQAEREGDA